MARDTTSTDSFGPADIAQGDARKLSQELKQIVREAQIRATTLSTGIEELQRTIARLRRALPMSPGES